MCALHFSLCDSGSFGLRGQMKDYTKGKKPEMLEPLFPNEIFRHIIVSCFLVIIEFIAVIVFPLPVKWVNKPDYVPWFLFPIYKIYNLIHNKTLFVILLILCAVLFVSWPFLVSRKSLRLFQKLFLFFPFAIGLLLTGCVVYPELAERGVKAPSAERCGDCHADIYHEWKNSSHAHSFTDPAFREETNEYQFTFCLGCHAPETIFTDGSVEARAVSREEGVNCNSCHLNDCKLSGPTPAHGPHPIAEKNPFFRTSEMCGKCHVGTFKTLQRSQTLKDKETCQGCHMPAIKRKLIQDDPWQKIYPEREGRQHLFSFEALSHANKDLLSLSFIKVTRSHGKIEGILELENTGVPHSIPTGDYGYREVIVKIELLDGTGLLKDSRMESLFIERGTALQYKEKRHIPFSFRYENGLPLLRATMTRTSFNKDRNILLAERDYKP